LTDSILPWTAHGWTPMWGHGFAGRGRAIRPGSTGDSGKRRWPASKL